MSRESAEFKTFRGCYRAATPIRYRSRDLFPSLRYGRRAHPSHPLAGRLIEDLGQPALLRQAQEVPDLVGSEIRMEEVEDEDEPGLIALVPRGVEKGVVEHDAAPLPLLDL